MNSGHQDKDLNVHTMAPLSLVDGMRRDLVLTMRDKDTSAKYSTTIQSPGLGMSISLAKERDMLRVKVHTALIRNRLSCPPAQNGCCVTVKVSS